MAFVKELIVYIVFVAVVVLASPKKHKDDAIDRKLNADDEINTDEDIDRNGHSGHGHSYSFHHFSGPVVGHHEAISWKDKHGHHHHDYKAHPKYKYSYGVDDHHTKDHHGQNEHRDGKHVEGEYHVHEPGGNVRSVKYHADPHGGFYAEVHNYGRNDHSGGTYGLRKRR